MSNIYEPDFAAKELRSRPAFRPLKVVLVDDSRPIRQRIAASLASVNGVDMIRQAGDVPSGLLLFERTQPDVLVVDIELPGESGIDMLKTIRESASTVVVIMLTIHDHPMLRQRCLSLGASFYFHKLTEFDRVAEVCADLVEQRRQAAGE